jgi:CHAT domain-containing protein
VVGLSRAFIIAGAPSVVVSQWNVDDVMTEYQMGEFYKSFLSGKSKVASLRDAQIKTIGFMDRLLAPPPGQVANRPNPRLWAAFQLIGDTN